MKSVKTSSGRNANLGGVSAQPLKSAKSKKSAESKVAISALVTKNAIPASTTFVIPSSDILSDVLKVSEGVLGEISIQPAPAGSILEALPKLQNSNFTPLLSRGIVVDRPEILAVFDYISVEDNQPDTQQLVASEFIKVQHAARALLHDNIKQLLEFLASDDSASSALKDVENAVSDVISSASFRAKFLARARTALDDGVNSLDPVTSQEAIKAIVSMAQSARDDNVRYGSLESLLTARGYTSSFLQEFSGTKVLASLLGDLNILLTDDRRVDPVVRASDASATDLVFARSGAFKITELASRDPVSSVDDLAYIESTLAADHTERVSVIIAALSRDLRISAALADSTVTAAVKAQIGELPQSLELIDGIVGVPSDSALTLPKDDRAALNSLYVRDERGFTVLPFETRAIRSGTSLYVPGSEYYVESIVNGRVPFDADPFSDVTSITLKKFTGMESVIRSLMLYDRSSSLLAADILEDILLAAKTACSGVTVAGSIVQKSALAIAILRASRENSTIKSLILKLINMIVMSRLNEDEKTSSTVDISNFSGLKAASVKLLSGIASDTAKIKTKLKKATVKEMASSSIASKRITPDAVDIDILKTQVAQTLEDEIVSAYTGPTRASIKGVTTASSTSSLSIASSGLFESVTVTSSTISAVLTSRNAIACIIDSIVDTVVSLVDKANAASGRSGFMVDDKTRYSGLSVSDITYLVFEVYVSLATTFMSADFVKTALSTEIKINVLPSKNSGFYESVEAATSRVRKKTKGLVGGELSATSIRKTLTAKTPSLFSDDVAILRDVADAYDDTIIAILEHLTATAQNASTVAESLSVFFSTKIGSANAKSLSQITSTFSAEVVPQLFLRTQIALSIAAIDNISSSGFTSPIENPTFDWYLVNKSALQLVKAACAKKSLFGIRDDATKIVTVGLPAGMTKAIPGAFTVGSSSDIRLPKENDVVRIMIYRKNYEFEDIVYKPKKFIFDISRFIRPGTFNDGVTARTTYDNAVSELFQFIDVTSTGATTSTTGDELASVSDYSFLTQDERLQMVSNHAISFIMEMYIRLIAGFDMSESSFLISALETSTSSDIVKSSIVLLQRLLGMSGTAVSTATLEQLRASSPEIDEFVTRLEDFAAANGVTLDTSETTPEETTDLSDGLTSNVLAFSKVFGGASFISGFGGLADRLSSPKAFERVFHIPVMLDSFEIDEEATATTLTGQALLASQRYRQLLKTTSLDAPVTLTPSVVRLDDLFVVIEPAYKA